MTRVSVFLLIVALIAGMVGCDDNASQNLEIYTWYDLDAVRDNLTGSYALMNDLDSTTAGYAGLAGPTANGGSGWEPVGASTSGAAFAGTFDGQGHEIHDVFVNRPDEDCVAVFGLVGPQGIIKNVGVVDCNITGYANVAGLVAGNIGDLTNCYAEGSVRGFSEIGGLAALNCGDNMGFRLYSGLGRITKCYATGNVTGNWDTGGLVAANDGVLTDCHAATSVSGNTSAGGLVASNIGNVANCYATGSVAGNSIVGGLIGENTLLGIGGDIPTGTVSNSFWDIETGGQATSDGGTGKTTAEMKDKATFSGAGWNIIAVGGPGERNPSYIWNIAEDVTYPFLSWQAV
jgi:hypothetical protein